MRKAKIITPSCVLIKNLLALSLGALLGVGCATVPQSSLILSPQSATPSPSLAELNHTLATAALHPPAPAADYRLGPEDFLQITLFNVSEADGKETPRTLEIRVSQQGVITLPLLGEISVAGLTASALEQELRKRYEKYLYDPQVGVLVREYRSQRVSVIGAVQKPGVFELSGPKTLIDLLAMAGGVTIGSAGSQVHLYRQVPEGRQSHVIDLYALTSNPGSLNLPVQGGDVINVPKAGMFFVDGAVRKPGSYPLDRPYTLTQALAVAGGADIELAKFSNIAIFRRRGPEESETIPINLDEIQAGRGIDPRIEAEDVIVVPMSTAKYLVRRFVGSIVSGFSLGQIMY